MSIFISTTFMPNQSSVLEAVRLLKERNIFSIELGSLHRCEKGLVSLLKSRKCNYLIHNFFPPSEERLILNIASNNECIRKSSLEFIKSAIDFAEKINASIYTIHPGFLVDPIEESYSSINYDFNFESDALAVTRGQYDRQYEVFLKSLSEISAYAKAKKIIIAIETQGSISKRDLILFSKTDDFTGFVVSNYDDQIGINLNLAHLYLASKAWGFSILEAINILKPKIKVVEVSHNDGLNDNHQALKKDGWYMNILKDDFFKKIPVIFEGRDLTIDDVENSYRILKDVCG